MATRADTVVATCAALLVGGQLAAQPGPSCGLVPVADALVAPTRTVATPLDRRLLDALRIDDVGAFTRALSAPASGGRGTATDDGDAAARAIAERMRRIGLAPLPGTTSLLAPVPLMVTRLVADAASGMTIGGRLYRIPKDVAISPRGAAPGTIALRAPVVFAAYGAPVDGPAPPNAAPSVDGAVVVLLAGRPRGPAGDAWASAGGLEGARQRLRRAGARAVAIVGADDAQPFAAIATGFARPIVDTLPSAAPAPGGAPTLLVRRVVADALLAGAGLDLARARALADSAPAARVASHDTVVVAARIERAPRVAYDVVGMLPGADRTLRAEAVVLSAHYDAFGRGADGSVYAGAADNALGVSTALAVADAVRRGGSPTARSIVVVATTGEELGLLGARHWVSHGAWPAARMAANLNFDGIGTEVLGPTRRIVAFGAEYSDLARPLADAIAATGRVGMPDPFAAQRPFYHSDNLAFAEAGVPSLMLLGWPDGDDGATMQRVGTWLSTAYHQPGDTVRADWSWEGPRALAEVGALLASRLASVAERPAWCAGAPFRRPTP